MLKKKYAFFYPALLLLASIATINCSDNNPVTPPAVDSSDFRYPFTDGSSWSFNMTAVVSNIRPDSIQHYFTDYPLRGEGTITILYDTLFSSVLTKCFLEEYSFDSLHVTNRYYYINSDTALILYDARLNYVNSPMVPLRQANTNVRQISNGNNLISGLLDPDPAVNWPYVVLKYPVRTGELWKVNALFNQFEIIKEYTGFTILSIPLGLVSCMVVRYSYDALPPQPVYYYYYSKNGLMAFMRTLRDVTYTTPANPDGVGIIDLDYESIVTSFHIAE